MPTYLVHSTRERARIRHAALTHPQTQARVFEFLQGQGGIAGIKPGRNSFLLLLEPSANIVGICEELEREFPVFAAGQPSVPPQAQPLKWNSRKIRLRALFSFGAATVGLALFGVERAHVAAGSLFALLAANHVWQRRKAL